MIRDNFRETWKALTRIRRAIAGNATSAGETKPWAGSNVLCVGPSAGTYGWPSRLRESHFLRSIVNKGAI